MWNLRLNPLLSAFCVLLILFVSAKTLLKGKTPFESGHNFPTERAEGLVDQEDVPQEVS